MNNPGRKFYIRLAGAFTLNYYWNQDAQNWTSDPFAATLFASEDAALDEQVYANSYNGDSSEVLQQRLPK